MDFKDYYQTLGVAKTANEKEIKQAFRKLARKHHPDVNPGDKTAESKFKEINEAYEVLGDPDKRRKYDELERLRLIKHLVEDVGVNLAGVQRLLSIAEAVQRLRPLIREDGMRSEARKRMVQEIERIGEMVGL